MNEFMNEAVREAYAGVDAHDGGPFGSVIVMDGKIVGRGHNMVIRNADPTCHGEMTAIRDACAKLGTHSLAGAAIYTTAEPCPMCLGAILWAGIREIYYGCTKTDTDSIGFADDEFYRIMNDASHEGLVISETDRDRCLELFEHYSSTEHEMY